MKAILLAAGFGSRLRPITNHIPKCVMPFGGRPLLDYWIESMQSANITDILVNTHYLSQVVDAHIRTSQYADHITLRHEDAILGTAGTLIANADWVGDEPVILIHADNVCELDVNAFCAAYQNRPDGTDMLMMTFETDTPQSCGIVALDDRGIVQEFHEKVANPPSNLANGAVYILNPNLLRQLAKQTPKPSDFSTEVLPHLMGRIATYHNTGYLRDIGTITSYITASSEWNAPVLASGNPLGWQTLCRDRRIGAQLANDLAIGIGLPLCVISDLADWNYLPDCAAIIHVTIPLTNAPQGLPSVSKGSVVIIDNWIGSAPLSLIQDYVRVTSIVINRISSPKSP
ncbi:MAG: nucleotidyltransferase family protein [bacterium]|nr:nucleotidyltransferase family protein [bacterium]